MSLFMSFTYKRDTVPFNSFVNLDGQLPSTISFSLCLGLAVQGCLFLLFISCIWRVSLINLRPGSIATSEAEGSMYLGQSGSTTLLVLNSVHLGLAPSISSIKRGSECFWMCLFLSGMG